MLKVNSSMRVVLRVLPYLWPKNKPWVKKRVTISLILLFLAKIISVLTPFLYKGAVDLLSGDVQSSGWMLGAGAVSLTVAYGIAKFMHVGFQQLRDVVFARVGQRALRQLAIVTFTHIHKLSMRYHTSRKTGGLSRIIERGVKGVDFLLRFLLFSIGPLFLELLMTSIILFFVFDVRFLLVVLITIFLYIIFTFSVTEWRVKIRKIMNEQDTDANQKAIDSLLNYETVKYFSAENREISRYGSAMTKYEAASIKTLYSLSFLNFGQSFFISSGLVVVMIMAAIGVHDGTMTVGDFVMVNAYMIQITMPLNFLGTIYREIRQAIVDMSEMFDLLEQPAEVEDKNGANELLVSNGVIEFKKVSFGYDRERNILKNISFTVKKGQTLAVVGSTGSGKSTIGRLLFRFYDVDKGSIFIDGQDISQVTQESLRRNIGMVPQDIVLFNDTIFYNIAYGKLNASKAEVESVAKAAKIHDFIMELPLGYDTSVGERGLKLSGGEKQRIAIARTLLKAPDLLVLDEATSSLDTRTEKDIKESLLSLGRGRTTIIIAHRLSTISNSDQIIVVEKGEVIESGTHKSLIKLDGVYASMWFKQDLDDQKVA
ncbi:MAG: ABCB family ABC transporter ATP-binding protein/permease [Rhodobacterales bacterium]|jgi:ABC-type transport system involved in Fe-S cluster assembly fused permease/ATPase subunit|tara:strand:- start:1351 stop:3144 length:1794 start_codon:yes stop_codon:yes gene_type:complete